MFDFPINPYRNYMQRDVLANPLLREMINEDLEMQIENEKR